MLKVQKIARNCARYIVKVDQNFMTNRVNMIGRDQSLIIFLNLMQNKSILYIYKMVYVMCTSIIIDNDKLNKN